MRLRHLYLLVAIAGLILPLYTLTPWTNEHGLDLNLIFALINASPVTATVGIDLMLAAIAGTIFIVSDGLRSNIRFWWVCLIGTYTIGFCFGLPLYLYLRDREMELRGQTA